MKACHLAVCEKMTHRQAAKSSIFARRCKNDACGALAQNMMVNV